VAIEFNCPHCGKLLTTSDERANARAKCPACDQLITVPATAPAPSLAGGVPSPALAATAPWSMESTPANSLHTGPVDSMVSMVPLEPKTVPGSAPGGSASVGPRPLTLCPNCHGESEAGSAFCSKCGMPLGPSGQALRYAEYWRRVAAVLFDFVLIGLAVAVLKFVLPGRTWVAENLGFLVWLLYHSALESSSEQATVGKRIMGIIVCGSDGRRLSFPRAAIRTLAKLLSFAICGVGFIMPLLTLRKQALHDVLTDSVVVEK
jgi:uncharacterized RDD family membrane protein YckC/phage FluMu protein Com